MVRAATGRLLAYGADTGALLWEAPYTADETSTPVVGGDVVYMSVRSVATNESRVVAFDLGDGAQLASLPVGSTAGDRVAAGPIVDGGRVVVGTTDGRIVAFGLPG